MNSVMSVLKVGRRVRNDDLKLRPGRNLIRGQSGRAYDFEAHPIETLGDLADVAAVYIYARDFSSADAHAKGHDAGAEDFSFIYAGEATDVAQRHRETQALGHLSGFDVNVALLVCVDNPAIRAEIVEDIITLHRPVLNDLLRSQHGRLRG
jgi:hypothetical protein